MSVQYASAAEPCPGGFLSNGSGGCDPEYENCTSLTAQINPFCPEALQLDQFVLT